MKKLKVAWICHFSNKEIRDILPLSKKGFKNTIISFFKVRLNHSYSDFAPWVTNLVKEFEKFDNVELHVIAPHYGMKHLSNEFKLNGVHYYFFKGDSVFFNLSIFNFFFQNIQPKFRRNRYFVQRFIKRINPDIVNLIGAENPYYSITSLDIKNIPVYVSVQTVYTNPSRKKYSDSVDTYRWNLELKIHQKEKYFGCASRMHYDLILQNNPEAKIFKMFFPIQYPSKVKSVSKIYDFVFFAAGINQKKGIEDALEALALVKKTKPDVILNIVGKCYSDYRNILVQKIRKLELENNIVFNDYFPLHADMYQHIVKSNFALLPVKLDSIPSTIIEAAILEIPIVTYKTTGTPYLNKNGESILLANIGDVVMLASNMTRLLTDPKLSITLKKNAKKFVEMEFNNTTSAMRLVSNYQAVINHYHNHQSIPRELLFDVSEFPIYK